MNLFEFDFFYLVSGGVQNLEWSNVERPIFRNFKITNIKITKDQLFDYFIYEFFYFFFRFTWPLKVFDKFSKLLNFANFVISQIKKLIS